MISFAYNIIASSHTEGRSLIYKLKSSRPKIVPCGTPRVHALNGDRELLPALTAVNHSNKI